MTGDVTGTRLPADQAARDAISQRTDATLFVGAGAGTGKTHALVERVQTLVVRDGVPVSEIAAVTFTEKAAAELRDRLRAAFELVPDDGSVAGSRAQEALDELDGAAIGTLHAFAQRILSEHPIEAGLPPVIEISDEITSSIDFETRWGAVQQALLEEESLALPLTVARVAGTTFDHLRSIVRALTADWDLIPERVISQPVPPLQLPGIVDCVTVIREVTAHLSDCKDRDDRLAVRLMELEMLADGLEHGDGGPRQLIGVLRKLSKSGRVGRHGTKGNWPEAPVSEVRAAVTGLADHATELLQELTDQSLRAITRFLADHVLAAAADRQARGALEFHDLLVLTRELVHADRTVRAALHRKYRCLLLDEFQDTDPIQLEIATRIAGGADADADRWSDIEFDPGRIFVVGDPKQSIYRFRRASIRLYLEAKESLGEEVSLTTNFRTTPPVLDWVNNVFEKIIVASAGEQPEYEPLTAFRTGDLTGPAVTVLGAQPHPADTKALALRTQEAADVAAAITEAMNAGWQVKDPVTGEVRAARYADIAILIPSRTSLNILEELLDRASIPYHAEARSLVYTAEEVRDLLMCARAVADPVDELALITALRSPLFGCGDDDLWRWKRDVGNFRTYVKKGEELPAEAVGNPVEAALRSLGELTRRARWLTPAEVLSDIIADRRMFEVAATGPRAVEKWRRLRFIVDQARGWSDAAGDGLRNYLAWVNLQATDSSRITESVAGELGLDSVRVLTVHAAKGLEFPITVLSGMSGRSVGNRGVRLIWPPDGGYEVALRGDLSTADFASMGALDEAMDAMERRRLMYVAATRARDHLIVSLHRAEPRPNGKPSETMAGILAENGAVGHGASHFASVRLPESSRPTGLLIDWPTPVDHDRWLDWHAAAVEHGDVAASISASGLEGTEPERAEARPEESEPAEVADGLAKGARDFELPPWTKGRYGSAVGRAVHGVLQTVDLATADGLDGLVASQCIAEGVVEHRTLVRQLVRSALASDVVTYAAGREHWRESYVATRLDDGQILEGYIDLIYRDDDGRLVIVDYKTDAVPAGALDSRDLYYRPQLEAYARALGAATDTEPAATLLYLHPETAVIRPIVK